VSGNFITPNLGKSFVIDADFQRFFHVDDRLAAHVNGNRIPEG